MALQGSLNVLKTSKKLEVFSIEKLKNSLYHSGANPDEIQKVIQQINKDLYDGISTNEIHKSAFRLLKKFNRSYASKYNLKRAIFNLGPTGYPFERLVAALLSEKGFKTQVSVILKGACINHEIDVLAEKDGKFYAIECKFHAETRAKSNVKVPLYINSRFIDVKEQWKKDHGQESVLEQGWLITNTRFTKDAIDYGKCIGLTMLSWDYPENKGFKTNIDDYYLYPITALTSISNTEKKTLLDNEIVLVKELKNGIEILQKLNFSKNKIKNILREVENLCHL